MKVILIALYDFYSIGIRGLHSYLNEQGHDVKSMFFKESTYTDGDYWPQEIQSLTVQLKEMKPDFIGVSVRSPLFPMYMELYKAIREHLPECKIIIGGAHPTGDPVGCEPYADYVVVGDGEYQMAHILDGHPQGYIVCPVPFTGLDSLPFQYYGGDTYALAKPEPPTKMSVYTTRGCFYSCTYCQWCK